MEKKLVKPGRLNMHADKILLNTRGEVKLSCPVQERWFDEPMNSNAFLGIPLNFSMAPERCKGTRGAHIRVYKQSLHTLLQKLSLYAMRCNAHQRKFLLWQAYIHCQFVMTHPTHNKNHQTKGDPVGVPAEVYPLGFALCHAATGIWPAHQEEGSPAFIKVRVPEERPKDVELYPRRVPPYTILHRM